jgi:hypothetical protein
MTNTKLETDWTPVPAEVLNLRLEIPTGLAQCTKSMLESSNSLVEYCRSPEICLNIPIARQSTVGVIEKKGGGVLSFDT